MGSWFSRPSNENTETEVGNPVAFRYPPKSGKCISIRLIS